MTSAPRTKSYEPDAALIELHAGKYRWDPAKLREVFRQIGPLTEEGQEKLPIDWRGHLARLNRLATKSGGFRRA